MAVEEGTRRMVAHRRRHIDHSRPLSARTQARKARKARKAQEGPGSPPPHREREIGWGIVGGAQACRVRVKSLLLLLAAVSHVHERNESRAYERVQECLSHAQSKQAASM